MASFSYATGRERRCEKKSISNSWDITFITVVAIMTSGELGTRCCVVFSAAFFLFQWPLRPHDCKSALKNISQHTMGFYNHMMIWLCSLFVSFEIIHRNTAIQCQELISGLFTNKFRTLSKIRTWKIRYIACFFFRMYLQIHAINMQSNLLITYRRLMWV